VVFGGFSAEALADRVRDSKARLIITADGGWRRGAIVPLKANVDHALTQARAARRSSTCWCAAHRPRHRLGARAAIAGGTTVERASPRHAAPAHDSEHRCSSLYTSGTTGKPKGILHTTGGYQVGAYYSSRSWCSICATTTSSGARPTSAGSPATPTWSTARS
jgi:acetyl-CoA synthetase